MKTIKVYLSKPKNHPFPIFSWLVRLVEHTKYSHFIVGWYDGYLKKEIFYESTGSGMNFINKKLFLKKHKIIKEFKFNSKNIYDIKKYAHDNAKRKYSIKQIFGLFIMRLLSLFNIKISNPFKDGQYSQICVETAAYLLSKGKIINLPDNIEDYGLVELEILLKSIR